VLCRVNCPRAGKSGEQRNQQPWTALSTAFLFGKTKAVGASHLRLFLVIGDWVISDCLRLSQQTMTNYPIT
jgi:hypothetical protein